jgi:hypothetical protein
MRILPVRSAQRKQQRRPIDIVSQIDCGQVRFHGGRRNRRAWGDSRAILGAAWKRLSIGYDAGPSAPSFESDGGRWRSPRF